MIRLQFILCVALIGFAGSKLRAMVASSPTRPGWAAPGSAW